MRLNTDYGQFDCSDEFSRQDFTRNVFVDIPDGTVIFGSCFACEEPGSLIFRPDMQGVTFLDCNLDNCEVPAGNVVNGGSRLRVKVQNDLRDWIVDEAGEPVQVVNERYWIAQGVSIDPAEIPAQFIRREEMLKIDYEKQASELAGWFIGKPSVIEEVRVVDEVKVTYVIVEGPGLFEKDGVKRRFDTDIATLLVKV